MEETNHFSFSPKNTVTQSIYCRNDNDSRKNQSKYNGLSFETDFYDFFRNIARFEQRIFRIYSKRSKL